MIRWVLSCHFSSSKYFYFWYYGVWHHVGRTVPPKTLSSIRLKTKMFRNLTLKWPLCKYFWAQDDSASFENVIQNYVI